MATSTTRLPVQPGEPAPDFTVMCANRDGRISLADFRDRSPLLLALFRGLYCPFCRRHVVLLGKTAEKLEQLGVRTLAVVGSDPDRVRLYLRYRPAHCTVAADPELAIHRAYGVPRAPLSAEIWGAVDSACVDLARDLRLPLGSGGAREAVERLDGFQLAESDQVDLDKHQAQFTAQFLVDRQGIVRWANIECARDGLAAIDRFPTDDEILTAARGLAP